MADLRYPVTVKSVAELQEHVSMCPDWARGKFAAEVDGRTLTYAEAVQYLSDRVDPERAPSQHSS